jgi:hypothetical protein
MTKVVLALGSFVAGMLSAFLILSGIQTSAWPQSPSATMSPTRPPMTGRGITTFFLSPGLEPKVPGLGPIIGGEDVAPTVFQQLDGLNCSHCTFRTPLLTYGGGAVRLMDAHFEGVATVQFKGPALNTLQLLKMLGALKKGRPNAPPPPLVPPPLREAHAELPNSVRAMAKAAVAVNFISAVGVTTTQ